MTQPTSVPPKQRRMLASGARIRGQWRYLVRSTRDPFGPLPMRAAAGAEKTGATRPGERFAAD